MAIPDKWKSFWNLWDIRVAILLSLSYQILLISIASLRKRTGNIFLTVFVWSSYLLADWIATFALGLIASYSNNDCDKTPPDVSLITFWAPFLLVHLGGPHSITAFSLEDNELWLRHLLQLIIHLFLVAYVFVQASLPKDFWIPITLVYLAGFIKYVERTRSLYLASLATLKTTMLTNPSAGSNYERLVQVYKSKDAASVPVDIILAETTEVEPDYSDREFTGVEVVQSGFRFFNDFKGLIVDLTYGHREWHRSRDFFFKTPAKYAFQIMEVELNFLYDMLYTKMVVVHSRGGFFFRSLCLVCILAAWVLFASHHHMLRDLQKNQKDTHRTGIYEFDIYITYTLIIGAIILDSFAIIKLIFSDWTIAKLENFQSKVLGLMLFVRTTISLDRKHRWSNSLSQHSLITYCLKERFKWIEKLADPLGAKDFFDEILYKKTVHVESDNGLKELKWIKKAVECNFGTRKAESVKGDKLKEFIFKELRTKALNAKTSKDAKEICSWRGESLLLQASRFSTALKESVEVEYDESVIRWHVATELCHRTEGGNDKDEHRQFCKILSEYMLYLLIMRPTMMSEVTGIVHIRFQDTCEEAKKFYGIGQESTREAQEVVGKLFRNIMEAIKKFFGFRTTPNEEANLESGNSGNKQVKHEESSNSRSRQEKQQVPTTKEAKKSFGSGQEPTSEAIEEARKLFGNNMEAIKKFLPCYKLLKVDTVIAPGKVKGGTSKSVLFDACIMAKDLKKLDAKERWEIMSKVWVELLCYAASHCKAHAHAKQLSKGGEFITFVWLLMIHFGMGEPFRVDPESRYKLVVDK